MAGPRDPSWVGRLLIEAAHEDQVRLHGGSHGLRDENALEAALARPLHRWQYQPESDLAALAASYGYGLANNHPFVDGNKRIAFVAMYVFLALNGLEIEAPEAEVVQLMLAVADRRCDEEELAAWLRQHVAQLDGA